MPPVFAHGRLRLYLLKLLDEAPRHGYEVIRLLEERFQGLYAPSAGTVYPRLAKLEAEGLVTPHHRGRPQGVRHHGRGPRRTGRPQWRTGRPGTGDPRLGRRTRRRDPRRRPGRGGRPAPGGARGGERGPQRPGSTRSTPVAEHTDNGGDDADVGDKEAWRAAKEEMRRAKQEWKEQARRAKDESRRAREEAQRASRQAKEAQDHARAQAQEEVQRIARRVQEQVQDHFSRGDWPTGVREGLTELAKEFGEFGKDIGKNLGSDFGFTHRGGPTTSTSTTREPEHPEYTDTPRGLPGRLRATLGPREVHRRPGPRPGPPPRPLPRRHPRHGPRPRRHGTDQLHEVRRHLSTAAARSEAALRTPRRELTADRRPSAGLRGLAPLPPPYSTRLSAS